MGYCMSFREDDFFISLEDNERGFPLVKELLLKIREDRRRHFAWVDDEELNNAQSLDDIIDAFGWDVDTDPEGNIISVYFLREKHFLREKLGDEEILFEVIAPYVKDGSYIEMNGEEGAIWRWVFKDGKCVEKTPNITW